MNRLFLAVRCVEAFILSASILAIACLIVLNVLTRMLTGNSIAAVGEICQFLIILITFAGLSHAAGLGRHIRMTALHDMLSHRARRYLLAFVSASTALLLLFLAVQATHYAAVVHRLGSISPVLRVPLYLVYACAPIGLASAALQYLLTTARNLRSNDAYLSYDVKDEYFDNLGGDV